MIKAAMVVTLLSLWVSLGVLLLEALTDRAARPGARTATTEPDVRLAKQEREIAQQREDIIDMSLMNGLTEHWPFSEGAAARRAMVQLVEERKKYAEETDRLSLMLRLLGEQRERQAGSDEATGQADDR